MEEIKVLNFIDAMKLAQIVTKYIDTESIKGITVKGFLYDLFSKIEESEIVILFDILQIRNFSELPIEDVMPIFMESAIKNNIVDLLNVYKDIGFSK